MNKIALVLLGLISISSMVNAQGSRNWANGNKHSNRGNKAATASSSSSKPANTSSNVSNATNSSNSSNSSKLYVKPFTSSANGVAPTGQIIVGNVFLTVTVDYESPANVILSGNTSSSYIYTNSSTSTLLDVFR